MSDLSVTVRVSPDVTERGRPRRGPRPPSCSRDRAGGRRPGRRRAPGPGLRCCADGDVVEPVRIDSAGRPLGAAALDRARARAGGAGRCSPRRSSASARRSRTASTTTSTSSVPFTPEDLAALEKRMQEIVKAGQRFSRRVVTDERGPRGAGRRAVQARADRPQGRAADDDGRSVEVGGAELTIYDNLDAKTGERVLERPVPRPARAHHPAHPGVQADAHRGGVLAGQREEPAAAAHLRHRVGDPGRAQGAPRRCSPRPRSATTASSAPSSTCSRFPDEIGSGLRGVPPQGRHRPPGDGGLLAARGTRRPGTSSSTPRTSPRRRCSRSPATWTGTPTACSRPWSWTRSRRDGTCAARRSTT